MHLRIGAISALLILTVATIQVVGLSNDDVGLPMAAMDIPTDHESGTESEEAASEVEDVTTGVHPALVYQEDAGVPGDAPAACTDLDRRRVIHDDGSGEAAMLVEVDDEQDAFLADTGLHDDARITLQIVPFLDSSVQTLGFDVLTADCGESVLDPDSSVYDSISPEAGDGEKVVIADLDKKCRNSKDYWKFHISGSAPSEIYVEWTNGEWERQSFVDGNNGAGNYITHANTEYDIRVAEAVVPDDWDGNFDLLQRPCDTVDGEALPPERKVPPPYKHEESLYAEWEVRELEYVLVVYIANGIVGDTTGGVSLMAGNTDALQKPCHRECSSGIAQFEMVMK